MYDQLRVVCRYWLIELFWQFSHFFNDSKWNVVHTFLTPCVLCYGSTMTVRSTALLYSTCVANTWPRARCTTWGFTLLPIYSLCVVCTTVFFAEKTVVREWEQSDYARETNYLWQTMWICHHRGQESGAERREMGKWKKTEEKGEAEKRKVEVDKKREELEDYWWQDFSLCAYR